GRNGTRGQLCAGGCGVVLWPLPLIFVSVASKGFSPDVSLLFATLAGRSISVEAKGFRGADRWQESNARGWTDFEGARKTTWRSPMGGKARKNRASYITYCNVLV